MCHVTQADPILECSTLTGIKAVLTQRLQGHFPQVILCSTPSGIKAVLTKSDSSSTTDCTVCSTPSGIKAVLTATSSWRRSRGTPSAQRLPASKRFSLWVVDSMASVERCSTPSGIKAVLTMSSVTCSPCSSGAQRLPASKRFSPTKPLHLHTVTLCSTPTGIKAVLTRPPARRRRWSARAQRLPASQAVLTGPGTKGSGDPLVLNAYRHQSGSHPALAGTLPAGHPVLNAFRHQSGSHDRAGDLVGRCRLVLNAFRHQSGSHRNSRVTAHIETGVLNAFRHQSGSHWPASRGDASISPGAQRLPASKRFSPTKPLHLHTVTLCSTPSGIKSGSHRSSAKVSGKRSCREPFMDPRLLVVKKRPSLPSPPMLES